MTRLRLKTKNSGIRPSVGLGATRGMEATPSAENTEYANTLKSR